MCRVIGHWHISIRLSADVWVPIYIGLNEPIRLIDLGISPIIINTQV